MATKQQMIEILYEGLRIEEDVIPIYSVHVVNTLFLSGLKGDKENKLRVILDKLKTDSERHKQMFESMIKTVEESDRDVY